VLKEKCYTRPLRSAFVWPICLQVKQQQMSNIYMQLKYLHFVDSVHMKLPIHDHIICLG